MTAGARALVALLAAASGPWTALAIAERDGVESPARVERSVESSGARVGSGLRPRRDELRALVETIRTGPRGARDHAVERLRLLDDPRATPLVIVLLGAPDAGAREAAAESLGLLRAGPARACLEALLAGGGACAVAADADPDPQVRCACAVALGAIGDARSAGALARALSDAERMVRLAAAAALSRVPPGGAVPALSRALAGDDYDLRVRAADALGHAGTPAARRALRPACKDAVGTLKEVCRRSLRH